MNRKMTKYAMAQVVSFGPPIKEERVQIQVSLCGNCGEKDDKRTRFSPSTTVFPHKYHSTDAPYSLITNVIKF